MNSRASTELHTILNDDTRFRNKETMNDEWLPRLLTKQMLSRWILWLGLMLHLIQIALFLLHGVEVNSSKAICVRADCQRTGCIERMPCKSDRCWFGRWECCTSHYSERRCHLPPRATWCWSSVWRSLYCQSEKRNIDSSLWWQSWAKYPDLYRWAGRWIGSWCRCRPRVVARRTRRACWCRPSCDCRRCTWKWVCSLPLCPFFSTILGSSWMCPHYLLRTLSWALQVCGRNWRMV